MGKRPALLCSELAECSADLDPTCMLIPNTTADVPAVTVANLDTCSLTGVSNGRLVPGFYPDTAGVPAGACTATQACTGDGFRCSYAAGSRFCKCFGGLDTCVPLGECYETSCSICQDCITKVNAVVASTARSSNPAAISVAWKDFCSSSLPRANNNDCLASAEAVLNSPNGNLGKRAATLCSWVKCKWRVQLGSWLLVCFNCDFKHVRRHPLQPTWADSWHRLYTACTDMFLCAAFCFCRLQL